MDIKQLRKAAGMTQAQFAEYFETSKRSVQNWEEGRRKPPLPLVKLMEYKLRKENLI